LPIPTAIPQESPANELYRGYSAHEHTVLFSNTRLALPQDIIVETLVAVVVVSVGLVLGAEKLKPISWRDWAGEIERDGGARNPYLSLEERYGFWDIRVRLASFFPLIYFPEVPWGCDEESGYFQWLRHKRSTRANSNGNTRPSGRSLRIGCGVRMCWLRSDAMETP